jgi:hypothetical protein
MLRQVLKWGLDACLCSLVSGGYDLSSLFCRFLLDLAIITIDTLMDWIKVELQASRNLDLSQKILDVSRSVVKGFCTESTYIFRPLYLLSHATVKTSTLILGSCSTTTNQKPLLPLSDLSHPT